MTKTIATFALAAAAVLVSSSPRAAAQSSMPMSAPVSMSQMHMAMHAPQLSVTASGIVDYVPDTARVTLGIRADSPSAATAVDTINKNTASVIAAIKARGVPDSAIKTVGYNLFYRETPNAVQPVATVTATASAAPPGTYQATEMLAVTVPVDIAGKVLDTAIGAGANESFGLSYQTSKFDALYREALAKAMKSARDTADALAKAGHVSIVDIESISNTTESNGMPMVRAAGIMSTASVLPGMDQVTATVYVVYKIK